MFHEAFTYRFFKVLEKIDYGSIRITTPDQKLFEFTAPNPGIDVELTLLDWSAVAAFAFHADIGLAETYRDGLWETDDLEKLLCFGLQNNAALEKYINGNSLRHVISRIMYLFTQNTTRGSKKNIHAHYDLGNEFYRLWLDPTMSYSAALFHKDNETLPTAQLNKYDRIVACLDEPKGPILEIGCGWGGFAERVAETTDTKVEGITISRAQHKYATKRLGNNADIVLKDYRKQQGQYDHIVSIEMFEAVGEKFWQTYFGKLKSLLSANGKAVIQTITIDDAYFELYRKSGDMIRTFIFPGGMLPSPTRFEYEAKKAGFIVGPKFSFGRDYARTMQIWQSSFENNIEPVTDLGFDEKFIRLWRFYLASCIALFHSQRTDVMQIELVHA